MSFRAFGLRVAPRFALPDLTDVLQTDAHETTTGDDDNVLELTLGTTADVRRAFSGDTTPPFTREGMLGDGCIYATTRGRQGDYLIEYRPRAEFHLGAGARSAICATDDVNALAWQRFLLDTVLGTAALGRGYEGLHAGAVQTERGVVAIAATMGGGKSTLCAALVRGGATLFADDLVFLSSIDGAVVAQPGPPLMNLSPEMPEGLGPDEIGRVIGDVDGECWTALDRPPLSESPLAGVVLLERGAPGVDAVEIEVLPPSPMPLLAHALEGNGDPERPRRRFELFADLAEQIRLIVLKAPLAAAPSTLAEAVERSIR